MAGQSLNTHLSFVPFVNYRQLRKIKKWAAELICTVWNSNSDYWRYELTEGFACGWIEMEFIVEQNSYPSWGGKVQFDYILSDSLKARSI